MTKLHVDGLVTLITLQLCCEAAIPKKTRDETSLDFSNADSVNNSILPKSGNNSRNLSASEIQRHSFPLIYAQGEVNIRVVPAKSLAILPMIMLIAFVFGFCARMCDWCKEDVRIEDSTDIRDTLEASDHLQPFYDGHVQQVLELHNKRKIRRSFRASFNPYAQREKLKRTVSDTAALHLNSQHAHGFIRRDSGRRKKPRPLSFPPPRPLSLPPPSPGSPDLVDRGAYRARSLSLPQHPGSSDPQTYSVNVYFKKQKLRRLSEQMEKIDT